MVFAEARALCQGVFFPCGGQARARAARDYLAFICVINALLGLCRLLASQCRVCAVAGERAGWNPGPPAAFSRGVRKRADLACGAFSPHRDGPAPAGASGPGGGPGGGLALCVQTQRRARLVQAVLTGDWGSDPSFYGPGSPADLPSSLPERGRTKPRTPVTSWPLFIKVFSTCFL